MTARRVSTSPCKGEVGREAAGRGSSPRFSRTEAMTARARRLRANLTDTESKLWGALRRGQINGLSFRRQHPTGPYTLDFYRPKIRLAIEVDGGQHAEAANRTKDARRNDHLAGHGILVVRYWNNDVLRNLEGVLIDIVRIAEERASMTPSPTLPLSGGGSTGAAP